MSKNHTYSIIVCAYNASSTIAACLHSLENLEFNRKRYEIIVVDDGSTDNTVEIVKKFKDVKLVKSDRNHGLAAARNLGLKHSSGGIIISYDADCTSSHDWLTMLDRAYQEVIVLERALTDRFSADEHRRFCEFLDRATATLVEQTPTTRTR